MQLNLETSICSHLKRKYCLFVTQHSKSTCYITCCTRWLIRLLVYLQDILCEHIQVARIVARQLATLQRSYSAACCVTCCETHCFFFKFSCICFLNSGTILVLSTCWLEFTVRRVYLGSRGARNRSRTLLPPRH